VGAQDGGGDGRPVGEKPWVQSCLGEAHARLEAMKIFNWRMAWSSSAAS